MKTRVLFVAIATAAVATLFSCTRELSADVNTESREMKFIATFSDSGTKTAIQSNGTSVWWSGEERINVFTSGGQSAKFTSSGTEAREVAEFTGSFSGSTDGETFYAVYPYNEANSYSDGNVTLTVPTQQTAVEGSFADDLFPSVAVSDNDIFRFYHVCGGFRFTLSQEGIRRITFEAIGGESLAGKTAVSFGENGKPIVDVISRGLSCIALNAPEGEYFKTGTWYYFVTLPTDWGIHYRLSFFKDESWGIKESSKAVTIKRGVFGSSQLIDSDVFFNEYEYVDLDLPSETLWAACNIGAMEPEDYGYPYAWGETEPKSRFEWDTYKWCDGNPDYVTKYNSDSSHGVVDNKTTLDPNDDAASINWGREWRMPTSEDIAELVYETDRIWTTRHGVKGWQFTSKSNGNSVFIPQEDQEDGAWGLYWSSSRHPDYYNGAWILYTHDKSIYGDNYWSPRSRPRRVRPVKRGEPSIAEGNIVFKDTHLGNLLIKAFDKDGDGKLSYKEAASVTSLSGVFGEQKDFQSFDEFKFFTRVTIVDDFLFDGWSIESITLPDNIQEIGRYAFSECKNLTNITFPKVMREIKEGAFGGSGLRSVSFPNALVIIRENAFYLCRSLTSVDIPDNVQIISPGNFCGCIQLKEFKGPYASGDGRLLVKNNVIIAFAPAGLSYYSIPSGLAEEIGKLSFADSELHSLRVISKYAFLYSSISNVVLPNSVELIKEGAFEGCLNLYEIIIPDSIEDVEPGAFCGCENLHHFSGKYASLDGRLLIKDGRTLAFAPSGIVDYTITDDISVIGKDSFGGIKVASITFPASVSKIEEYAMAYSEFEFIRINATTPPIGGLDMFYGIEYPIYVPDHVAGDYRHANIWEEYAKQINPQYAPAVDLGLSVKWAAFNIGASSVTDYGGYYAWGELYTKWYYDGEHYLLGTYNDGIVNMNYYNMIDGVTCLRNGDDVAYQYWGAGWFIPEKRHFEELLDNCEWEWATINNVKGVLFTSRKNGRTLFFPCAGLIEGTTDYYRGSSVYYWAATKPAIGDYDAHCFASMNGQLFIMSKSRELGMPIRPCKW